MTVGHILTTTMHLSPPLALLVSCRSESIFWTSKVNNPSERAEDSDREREIPQSHSGDTLLNPIKLRRERERRKEGGRDPLWFLGVCVYVSNSIDAITPHSVFSPSQRTGRDNTLNPVALSPADFP